MDPHSPLLLLICTFTAAAAFVILAVLRYRKSGLFMDPVNYFVLNLGFYFTIEVPFVFFPGNLYLIGTTYDHLWGEIWFCFGLELGYSALVVLTTLFLLSSYVKRRISLFSEKMVSASDLLFSGHRYWLLFLVPVAIILMIFVAKYGAALLLVDDMGTAKARTVILREAASFRFLFNFASTALAMLLFYISALALDSFLKRGYIRLLGLTALFAAGAIAAFIVTGTRSFILVPIVNLIVLCLMFSTRHNRPGKVVFAALLLIMAAASLEMLRAKSAGLFIFNIFFKGDSFADFRDMVWSYQNFHAKKLDFWMGRTYLASWISFIPASVIPFREEWAFGRAIMRVVGWGSSDHFGIRSGMSGAIYYNGGVLLVAVMAVIRGAALFFEQKIFRILFLRQGSLFGKMMILFISARLLETAFFVLNSQSMWIAYVNVGIILTGFLMRPFFGLRTREDNRLAREAFPAPAGESQSQGTLAP